MFIVRYPSIKSHGPMTMEEEDTRLIGIKVCNLWLSKPFAYSVERLNFRRRAVPGRNSSEANGYKPGRGSLFSLFLFHGG